MAAARPILARPALLRAGHLAFDTPALVATLAGLAYAVVLALNLASLLAPPRLSLSLEVASPGRARVTWVLPGSRLWDRGVRPGSPVLTLDGRSPTRQDAGTWTGTRLLARDSSGHLIRVAAASVRHGRQTWPLLLLSPLFLLFGTLIVLRASPPAVGRVTYALFTAIAFAFALAAGADGDEPLAAMAEWAALPVFSALFVLFALTFPRPRVLRPAVRAVLAGLPLAAIALGLAAVRWPALYGAASLARAVVLLAGLLLGAGLLVRSYLIERERETRRRLTVMCASTATAALIPAALSLLPAGLGYPALVAPEWAMLTLALFPAGFAYAILRHRVLDVHLVQRWLIDTLLWVTMLLVGVAVVYVLRVLPGMARGTSRIDLALVAALTLALVAGAFMRCLFGRVKFLLDRLIFKDAYDYRASLQRLSRDLSVAGDADALSAELPAALCRLMNLDFAVLLVHGMQGEPAAHGAAGAYQTDMLPTLAAASRGVLEEPSAVSLTPGAPSVLLVPLHSRETVIGHLCLGPKVSGEPFRAADRALLVTLSGHLAAVVRNASLVDDLRAKVALLETRQAALDRLNERLQRAQEEERARIVADVHDESLQTALLLRGRLAAEIHDPTEMAARLALGDALVAQLHALCTSVRPMALDELGLAAAIEMLAVDLAERMEADVTIRLDIEAALRATRLSPGADVVLYRAAQEALNSSLRHGRPAIIDLALWRQDDTVWLRVADDGVGFAAPARVDDLATEGHLGLAGLSYRMRRAGGRVSVTSAPGRGATVEVELPLEGVTA